MRMEPALEHAAGTRVVVRITLEGPDGIREREAPSAEFEANDRGLSIGPLLIPWARVFRYDVTVHQTFVPDADEGTSRVMQRVVYQDERGNSQTIEVPLDRFENGLYAATMVADREFDAERGEIRIRKISIPWHRIIEAERIFAVPEAKPSSSDR